MKLDLLPIDIEEKLLTGEAMRSLVALTPELQKAYFTRQIFRTETEARISVLNDIAFPTKAAKYWQTIREQTVMLDELASLSFEFRRNNVSIKRIQRSLAVVSDELDREELLIDLEDLDFRQLGMQRVAADRLREIIMWSKLKAELDDGSFDTQNVDAHQLITYTTQFALRAGHTHPDRMTEGELNNLAGQFQTSVARCHELGVLDQVLANLPSTVASDLKLLVSAPA